VFQNKGPWAHWNDLKSTDIPLGFEYEIDTYHFSDSDKAILNGPNKYGNYSGILTSTRHYEITDLKLLRCAPFKKLPEGYHVSPETTGGRKAYEVKSHIAPLRIHRKQTVEFLTTTNFNMEPSGLRNGGGIHVNIEKTAYTNTHFMKVGRFFHNPTHRDNLYAISGRCPDARKWCEQIPAEDRVKKYKKIYGYTDEQALSSIWAGKCAIITLSKPYAYELRLFSAHPDLLLPALETADSVFRYAAHCPSKITWDGWVRYIRQHLRYRNITALVDEKCAT
jgi:hypothetical protein